MHLEDNASILFLLNPYTKPSIHQHVQSPLMELRGGSDRTREYRSSGNTGVRGSIITLQITLASQNPV